jgi:hypothetical protein
MRDYTKIEAWRLADDLTVAVYERTRSFPREEIYGLTSQLRRAAYSVPANIVEGASREEQERLPSLSLHCARFAVRDSVFHSPCPETRLLIVRGG